MDNIILKDGLVKEVYGEKFFLKHLIKGVFISFFFEKDISLILENRYKAIIRFSGISQSTIIEVPSLNYQHGAPAGETVARIVFADNIKEIYNNDVYKGTPDSYILHELNELRNRISLAQQEYFDEKL